MQILEYLFKNNLTTLDELQAGISEPNRERLMDNVKAAMDDGLIERIRDDVTNQPAYQLTSKGVGRVKAGHMSVNGKTAEENKAASDARDTEPAPADAALLAKVENLESDIRKQRTLLASKTERIVALEKEVAELQDCTADELVGTVAKLMEENAALRKEAADARDHLEEAQRGLMEGATLANSALMQRPIGYAHVWSDGFTRFDTEQAARADIERSFVDGSLTTLCESHLCAILNSAEVTVKWARS